MTYRYKILWFFLLFPYSHGGRSLKETSVHGYLVCDERFEEGTKIIPLGKKPSREKATALCAPSRFLGYAPLRGNNYVINRCTSHLVLCRYREEGREIGILYDRKFSLINGCEGTNEPVRWPFDEAKTFCPRRNNEIYHDLQILAL